MAISSPAAGRVPDWTAQVTKDLVGVRDAFDQHVDRHGEAGRSLRRDHGASSAPGRHGRSGCRRSIRRSRRRSRRWSARGGGRGRAATRGRSTGRATTSSGSSARSSATVRRAPTSSGRRTTSTSAAPSSARITGLARVAYASVVVRIALGQLNTTVGDLDGNVARMVEWTTRAAEEPAPTSSASPSSRSPAIRPRTWCCVTGSSRTTWPRSTRWPSRPPDRRAR